MCWYHFSIFLSEARPIDRGLAGIPRQRSKNENTRCVIASGVFIMPDRVDGRRSGPVMNRHAPPDAARRTWDVIGATARGRYFVLTRAERADASRYRPTSS